MLKAGLKPKLFVDRVHDPKVISGEICVNLRDADLHGFCKEVWNFTYNARALMRVVGTNDFSRARTYFLTLSEEQYREIGLKLELVYPEEKASWFPKVFRRELVI
jgi:hypothetical protein